VESLLDAVRIEPRREGSEGLKISEANMTSKMFFSDSVIASA
jgi:hypothetical protein